MPRSYTKWAGRYPPGSPAGWVADGHVTANVQCLGGNCRQMVDVRLDTLPLDLSWSEIGWRLKCTSCGVAGAVNIVPNWHDQKASFAGTYRTTIC